MHDHADRLDFAPPPQPAALRAFALAIVAHLLLLLALTWGVNWKRESEDVAVEAELWSATPQQAAPAVVRAPPLPTPQVVAPPPPPAPTPKVVAPPPPPAPVPKQPDIALEREKKRQELAERKKEELEKQKLAQARKLEAQKKELARKAEQEKEKAEELAKAKAAKAQQEKLAQAKAEKAKQEEARLTAIRKENMERMRGLAGATGAPSSTGTAARSAGPSESYAGRIRARVRPNIVFTDDIAGNPTAEVEVRMAPDGTITSRRVVKSSGAKSWDEAVLRALDRTEILPRDVDGRIHTPLIIEFRPRT